MTSRLVLIGLTVALILCLAQPAAATFPGRNGEIVLLHQGGSRHGMQHFSLLTFAGSPGPPTSHPICRKAMDTWPFCDWIFGPAYAPRGTRIAVTVGAFTPGTAPALWLLSPDGRLASSRPLKHEYRDPHWAPDGSALIATRTFGEPPGPFSRSVFVLGRDGSERELLEDAAEPDWCVGGRIVLVRFGTLRVVEPNGRMLRRTVPGASEPSCSPDGRRVAFTRDGHIWTTRLAGGRARRLTPGYAPVWSPDGKQIAFLRDDASTGADHTFLHRIGLRRGIVRPVSTESVMGGEPPDGSLGGPEWRPLRRRR